MNIKTVTVIGANGTMGANNSGIFASFGNAKVYMVSRDIDKSKKAARKAGMSVRAETIMKNLIPVDYSMLPQCVPESDLVFEAVSEDLELKLSVAKQLAPYLRKDAIVCFGTSGLSITTLAEAYPEYIRGNCFGVHLFNPPYNMTLCEFTPTKYSKPDLADKLKEYLSDVLYRTVVEVKDSPAFLGNRIGFQLINEALLYAEKYKYSGGIDYIDAILGPFTGRTMAPLTTSDFVGLDVHKAIVDNLYENTSDYAKETFIMPKFAIDLIAEGKLGRKSNGGLYKREVHDNGLKRFTVYDIETGTYRDKMHYQFPFAVRMVDDLKIGDYQSALHELVTNRSQEADICLEFLLKYIIYSLVATENVGYDIKSADDVMATGFNWCPPLAMYGALSAVADLKQLIYKRLDQSILEKVEIERILLSVKPSKYDYRLYFKSGR